MKWFATISLITIVVFNGCGGGGTTTETFYLQTCNNTQEPCYTGVENVRYQCGSDAEKYTDANGSFIKNVGADCTFYDLNSTISYEAGTLYLKETVDGGIGLSNVPYSCLSEPTLESVTDENGTFSFDPNGDTCTFNFPASWSS